MARDLTTDVLNASLAEHVVVLALVELDFSSGFVRVTNAGHDIVHDSNTWLGVGALGSIDVIKEPSELYAAGVSFKLSGIPSALVTTATTEHYQGRSAKVWVAFCNTNTHAILADPHLLWVGRMDVMTVEMGAEATITVASETRFADWDRARIRRYNDADQQAEYSGDTGLRYMEQLVEKQLVWGAPGSAVAPSPQGQPQTSNPFNQNYQPPVITQPGVTGAGSTWKRPTQGPGSDRPYGAVR